MPHLFRSPAPLRILVFVSLLTAGICDVRAADPASHSVFDAGQQPDDARLQAPKDLNGYFPFIVPESKAAWEQRQAELQQRVLVATGLYPMPEKTPLNPVIHGLVRRDGFTIEKVYFESLPGHFVSGLLFRPEGQADEKRPGVLSPHGHGGRQYNYGADKMDDLLASGAEIHRESGQMPKMARCAQLARMGCVTFIFDMLGYVDSQQISYEVAHRYGKRRPEFESDESWGFYSPQAEARLHSVMGLQTWNAIRSLDFLASLPDVDPKRLAVTGGSGGGTQTILLGAIDPRPIASFPNGMVSTAMQGGCTCENCSLLRIGTGNVELAALFAPRPQGMTAANDWTKDMMTKGYPELQQLYAMLGVPGHVYCEEMLQFPHNYNAVTRRIMYGWMNSHLDLKQELPIEEQDWKQLSDDEVAVWNGDHPAPPGGPDYERSLLQQLDERDREVLQNHAPASDQAESYLSTIRSAWQTLIGRDMPSADDIQRTKVWKESRDGYIEFGDVITLTSHNEQLPVVSLYPTSADWNGKVVLWLDGHGKANLFTGQTVRPEVRTLLDAGFSIVGVDLFGQGEFTTSRKPLTENPTVSNPRQFAGYTYCYNDTIFARRVHDILTTTAWIRSHEEAPEAVYAVGINGTASLLAAARAITGTQLDAVALDTQGFRFANLNDWKHADFLPGAVKYGDLPGLLALSAPHKLWISGEDEVPATTTAGYRTSGDAALKLSDRPETVAAAVDWLLLQ